MSARPFRLTAPVVPEDDLHQAVADAFRVLLPRDCVWTTWELRNAKGAEEGARRKRLGARAGWPDIGVFWRSQRGERRVCLIELKRERHWSLSQAQKELHPELARAGFPVVRAHTVVEALDAVLASGIPVRGRVAA